VSHFFSYYYSVGWEAEFGGLTGYTLVVPAVLRASDFSLRAWVRFPFDTRLTFFLSGLSVLVVMDISSFYLINIHRLVTPGRYAYPTTIAPISHPPIGEDLSPPLGGGFIGCLIILVTRFY
jgi:hypothetical protein